MFSGMGKCFVPLESVGAMNMECFLSASLVSRKMGIADPASITNKCSNLSGNALSISKTWKNRNTAIVSIKGSWPERNGADH